MPDHFEHLVQELDALRALAPRSGPLGFFTQEALRFYSIAGTLKSNFNLDDAAQHA